ncbi:hypothetical protein [Nannocystis punicea]|uniref:Lipoprotein n=1 Tax=Nannocystis punicea TaxID=2995304 RepID=A0ABY7HHZ4_9BACT|nr:hypothetical protein [Nannocystis poenicansa]WAS98931.1 hypothetical protein O0S08_22600 [Nannocystis poenicansa]
MSSRAAIFSLFLATSAVIGCTGAGEGPSSSDMSQKTPPPPADGSPLEGFPLSRLRFEHNPVELLTPPTPLDEATLKARGVQSHRTFTATTPQVWLFVFEFTEQNAMFAALQDPRLLLPGEPPYYTAAAFTGRWLLITGFPSEKPVSPEMEAARTMFLERWAGQE